MDLGSKSGRQANYGQMAREPHGSYNDDFSTEQY